MGSPRLLLVKLLAPEIQRLHNIRVAFADAWDILGIPRPDNQAKASAVPAEPAVTVPRSPDMDTIARIPCPCCTWVSLGFACKASESKVNRILRCEFKQVKGIKYVNKGVHGQGWRHNHLWGIQACCFLAARIAALGTRILLCCIPSVMTACSAWLYALCWTLQ